MEIFAPIQYDQIQSWPTRCKNSLQRSIEALRRIDPAKETEAGIKALAGLNLISFIEYSNIKLRTQPKVTKLWQKWSTTSDLGRWITPIFDHFGWAEARTKGNVSVQDTRQLAWWTRQSALTPESHPKSWIASAFAHRDFTHLLSNMMGFWLYAPVCAKIPGMTLLDVQVMVVGSSVFASIAQLIEWDWEEPQGVFGPRRLAMGASGVVAGFGALAAMAVPQEPIKVFGCSVPCSKLVALQFLNDAGGLFRGGYEKQGEKGREIGYAAHLGGALFGVLYYHLVMKRIRSSTQGKAGRRRHSVP